MSDAAPAEVQAPFVPSDPSEFHNPNESLNVTLPSGQRAVIRRPNSFFLAKTGQVPETVKDAQKTRAATKTAAAKAAARAADDDMSDAEMMETIGSSPESIAAIDVMADFMVAKSFLKPRVTLSPSPGRVWIGDLTSEDKAFVVETLQIEL